MKLHNLAPAAGSTKERKRIGRGQKFPLTDDAAADTRRIQEIYEAMDLGARHPDQYLTH